MKFDLLLFHPGEEKKTERTYTTMSFNFRLSQLDPLPQINGAKYGNTIGQGSFAMYV